MREFGGHIALLALLALFGQLVHAQTARPAEVPPLPTAEELLKAADRPRGGLDNGLAWSVEIETFENGDRSERAFQVTALGDNAMARVTFPATAKDEVFLFNNTSMWYFKPGKLRKPVSLSQKTVLSGQAANGDIANTHYSRDYDAKIVGEEILDGEVCHVLELRARNKNVTYDQIRYWISKKGRLGRRADFLALDGQPLKSATFAYDNTLKVGKEVLPFVSRVEIRDSHRPDNRSIMVYREPVLKDLSSQEFTVNRMDR